jgi:hypothetical protein
MYNYTAMYRRPSKKKELIKRIITYVAMTLSVLAIVSVLILVILGYRIDSDNGRIEQGALLQFDSSPSGASVAVDGKNLGSTTSTKTTVLAGTHKLVVQKSGYQPWQKSVDVKAGTLTWLNYILLVPISHSAQSVATYSSLYASLGTPDGKEMLVQQSPSDPTFQVVNLQSDDIKSTTVTIPTTAYSEATTAGMTHTFTISQWDAGDRYVLVQHTYGDKKEWLVLDTKNVAASKNVTTSLDLDISHIVFSGTSGNILYALSGTDIRKLDLSAGTISRSLVSNVTNFDLYQPDIITYTGTDPVDATKSVVGFYRDGDSAPHVLRSVTTDPNAPLHIATTHYFNEDYVAISEGNKVDITAGSYPSSGSDDNSSLAPFATFTFATNVDSLSFSIKGDYLLAQAGATVESYNIEHMLTDDYTLTTDTNVTVPSLQWLDDAHTWSDYGGNLIMREYDGANAVTLNQSVSGQGVALTQNDKYIYSLGKTASGYDLQRVRLILP